MKIAQIDSAFELKVEKKNRVIECTPERKQRIEEDIMSLLELLALGKHSPDMRKRLRDRINSLGAYLTREG